MPYYGQLFFTCPETIVFGHCHGSHCIYSWGLDSKLRSQNNGNGVSPCQYQNAGQDLSKSELMPLAESSNLDHLFDARKSTITTKYFPGGIMRLVAARSPRALRRLTAKVLICDEIDGYQITSEGDPVDLAIKRTATFRDRKLIFGSSPANEPSPICELYKQSDQRIFEVPCPDCGEFTEILWEHIIWETDRPETASFGCPHCGSLIEHRFKPSMIRKGR